MFVQNPAFTVAALAALTLGIGANTAIFSVVNTVLLRPAAFPDPDRVVIFMNTSPQSMSPAASPAKFQHYRQQSSVVQDVTAFNTGVVNYTGGEFPEQLRSARVSSDFFRLFGASIAQGRSFAPEEDLPRGPKVVVLSHGLWTSRFGSDPRVIGRSMSLSSEPYEIIGVLGEFDFRDFGPEPQVWIPFQLDPNSSDQGHYFQTAGRVKPGVTVDQAKARLAASANDFKAKYPNGIGIGPQNGFTVQPVREALARNVRTTLLVLVGAVSFVLLIACANVANLLLVRAAGRRREVAIRAAIGGSRGRIIRQLLTESVVLSVVGGVLGLGLGWLGIRALLGINTAGLPRVGDDGAFVGVDWRVLAVHDGRLGRHRHRVRPHPRAAQLEDRPRHDAQGRRRTVGHRLAAEPHARRAGRRRSRARARPPDRLRASDPDVRRAHACRSRVRCDERVDDADVAHGEGIRTGRSGRAARAHRRRSASRDARRRERQRHVLRAAPGRLRARIHHRRTAARERTRARRRRLDDGLARLFRGLQDPGQARPDVHGPRQQQRAAGRDHQRDDGAAVLAETGSAERSPDHRPRCHARVRDRGRTADHRGGRRHARRRAARRSATADVHSAGAGARRGQRAQRPADADGMGGADADAIRRE